MKSLSNPYLIRLLRENYNVKKICQILTHWLDMLKIFDFFNILQFKNINRNYRGNLGNSKTKIKNKTRL